MALSVITVQCWFPVFLFFVSKNVPYICYWDFLFLFLFLKVLIVRFLFTVLQNLKHICQSTAPASDDSLLSPSLFPMLEIAAGRLYTPYQSMELGKSIQGGQFTKAVDRVEITYQGKRQESCTHHIKVWSWGSAPKDGSSLRL